MQFCNRYKTTTGHVATVPLSLGMDRIISNSTIAVSLGCNSYLWRRLTLIRSPGTSGAEKN